MGLFDMLNGDSDDGQGFGEFMNEMMNRARESQYITRWYTLANGVYVELSAIEPENRTANQNVVMEFLENIGHFSVSSLGWCDKHEDPLHVEEHKTEMRAAAIEAKQDWDRQCAENPESGFEEVNHWMTKAVESI